MIENHLPELRRLQKILVPFSYKTLKKYPLSYLIQYRRPRHNRDHPTFIPLLTGDAHPGFFSSRAHSWGLRVLVPKPLPNQKFDKLDYGWYGNMVSLVGRRKQRTWKDFEYNIGGYKDPLGSLSVKTHNRIWRELSLPSAIHIDDNRWDRQVEFYQIPIGALENMGIIAMVVAHDNAKYENTGCGMRLVVSNRYPSALVLKGDEPSRFITYSSEYFLVRDLMKELLWNLTSVENIRPILW